MTVEELSKSLEYLPKEANVIFPTEDELTKVSYKKSSSGQMVVELSCCPKKENMNNIAAIIFNKFAQENNMDINKAAFLTINKLHELGFTIDEVLTIMSSWRI